MNKPAVPRKFSLHKNRYTLKKNDSSSFMSKYALDNSQTRRNAFNQTRDVSRGRDSSERSKNTSVSKRYFYCYNYYFY